MPISIEAEQQCALKRANASLSPTGYWHTSFAKDEHGRIICTIDGRAIKFSMWIEPQEDKTDEEFYHEFCLEQLIEMYNEGRRQGKKVFDDHTASYNGLWRDVLKYRFLKEDLDRLYMELSGVRYYGGNTLVVLDKIKELEPEYEKYKAKVCPPE